MAKLEDSTLWALAHAERAALAEDLAGLTPEQWHHETLCREWDVEQVVAHLSAAASTGQGRWLRSMIAAGFRPGVHNARRLKEQVGGTPAETLTRFRAVVDSTVAPSSDTAAYLGEVVVHAQDIRFPLGIERKPSVEALTPVAAFYASRNFAVPSRSNATGLRLESSDGPFKAGTGALVTGPTLALVMIMAGRAAYLTELEGPGTEMLVERLR